MISRDRHLSLVAVEGHSHISKLWRSSSKVMLVMFCWKTLMCHLDHIWFIWWFQFFLRKTSMSCLHQLWDWFTLLHYKYDKIHYIHIYCIYLSILYLFKDHQDWPIPACFFFQECHAILDLRSEHQISQRPCEGSQWGPGFAVRHSDGFCWGDGGWWSTQLGIERT
jgi:hypothetical protein